MRPRSLSALILIVLLLYSFVGLSIPSTPSASAQSSCPANRTLQYVAEPIPQSLNLLSPSGDSTFEVGAGIEQLSLFPFPLGPNGSLWWGDSATDWYTTNSNYTQWTFNIRPGLKWSDGSNVTSQDVLDWLNVSYALNPQFDFPGLGTEIASVTTTNSSTVVVNLNVSDAHFPERASSYYYAPLVPPSEIAQGPSATLLGTNVVDGPYYAANYTSGGTTMTMLQNQYWKNPTPTVCEIAVTFVENSAAMVPYLVSGQADYAGPIAYGNIPTLKNYPFIHLVSDVGSSAVQLVYNVTAYPYNMTQFRQALAYSFNSSAIVQQALYGYGVSSSNGQGEVPSSFSLYNPHQANYDYNQTAALNLLESIGFTKGTGGVLQYPNGTAVSLTIWTDTALGQDVNIATMLDTYLSNLGVHVSVQTTSEDNLISSYAANANGIRDQLVVFTSEGPFYSDAWLDAQPGCSVLGIPGCFGWQTTHWEYPLSADNLYQGNLTAVDSTNNAAQVDSYLNNIQALNAQYLPVIILAYPSEVLAYNTQHWTNWPSSNALFQWGGTAINKTMIASLTPAGTSSTTSTTPSGSSTGLYETAAAIVVVVIVVAAVAVYVLRRRGPAK